MSQESSPHEPSVLIVDDNPENLRVLGNMLRKLNYRIRVASNGEQALKSMEAAAPDILLLDIHMPGMDGYEVCRRLKASQELADIPVIFLSALTETFNKVTAYECGGADYITKPFQFEEVHVRLQAHLKNRRLLAESQAGFRSSFEQAAVGMAHLNLSGGFIRVNSRFCQMLGYAASELLQQPLDLLLHEADYDAAADQLNKLRSRETDSLSVERLIRKRDASLLWCRCTISLVYVHSSNEQYFALLMEDISQRKSAEEERQVLAAAINQAREAVLITDAAGRIQYINSAARTALGFSPEEGIGKHVVSLTEKGITEAMADEIRRSLAENEIWLGRLEKKQERGLVSIQEATVSPVRNSLGEAVNYIAVARDITEQVGLETRLRQAQKMEAIGALAGGIAHDFNNILSAILGYTDLALAELPKESEVHACLREVASAGERARDLVAQILTFSRQADREIRPVRVQVIIQEALRLLRGSIPSTIEIRQEIDKNCQPIMADSTAIHQVLMNLCTNAYHAMREKGGRLLIRLKQIRIDEETARQEVELTPGPYVRLEVHDTGYGMDAQTQARIFEPYFTTKERGEGTGLGLATIHGIVKDLGGAIHVYSELGNGAVFTILLPCVQAQEGKKEFSPTEAEALGGSEQVLLVDDERPIGQFAQKALERLGYAVTVFNSSPEALRHFQRQPEAFDVVVTDQMMPQMKGHELSARIHEIRPGIPIILCSGFSEGFQNNPAESKDIKAHVMKPIIGADLARAIRTVLTE